MKKLLILIATGLPMLAAHAEVKCVGTSNISEGVAYAGLNVMINHQSYAGFAWINRTAEKTEQVIASCESDLKVTLCKKVDQLWELEVLSPDQNDQEAYPMAPFLLRSNCEKTRADLAFKEAQRVRSEQAAQEEKDATPHRNSRTQPYFPSGIIE